MNQPALIDDIKLLATVTDTYADVTVTVGQDTTLEPGTVLRGATAVGADCRIGPHVVAVDATIEDGVSVGPFAYLRPGTILREGSKAGTFVEIKNSDVGAGSKVPHLSYIGDADIGEFTNIGAGTVTCNYDGVMKHRTKIGKRAFIGSDTMLVAPVQIGDDALTASGSVITQDVPAEALALARAAQINKPGLATKLMARLKAIKAAKGKA